MTDHPQNIHAPITVYNVLMIWTPDRDRQQFHSQMRDQVEIIATFNTLNLANEAANLFVNTRLENLKQSQRKFSPNPDIRVRRNKFKILEDGCMRWTVYAPYNFVRTTVETKKQTVRDRVWSEIEMPHPSRERLALPERCGCDEQCHEHHPNWWYSEDDIPTDAEDDEYEAE